MSLLFNARKNKAREKHRIWSFEMQERSKNSFAPWIKPEKPVLERDGGSYGASKAVEEVQWADRQTWEIDRVKKMQVLFPSYT